MKTRQLPPAEGRGPEGFPDAASLAALRAWYEGLPARDAVVRYLGARKADGASSRGILGAIRRQLASFARRRQRPDLAAVFAHSAAERIQHAGGAVHAIE